MLEYADDAWMDQAVEALEAQFRHLRGAGAPRPLLAGLGHALTMTRTLRSMVRHGYLGVVDKYGGAVGRGTVEYHDEQRPNLGPHRYAYAVPRPDPEGKGVVLAEEARWRLSGALDELLLAVIERQDGTPEGIELYHLLRLRPDGPRCVRIATPPPLDLLSPSDEPEPGKPVSVRDETVCMEHSLHLPGLVVHYGWSEEARVVAVCIEHGGGA